MSKNKVLIIGQNSEEFACSLFKNQLNWIKHPSLPVHYTQHKIITKYYQKSIQFYVTRQNQLFHYKLISHDPTISEIEIPNLGNPRIPRKLSEDHMPKIENSNFGIPRTPNLSEDHMTEKEIANFGIPRSPRQLSEDHDSGLSGYFSSEILEDEKVREIVMGTDGVILLFNSDVIGSWEKVICYRDLIREFGSSVVLVVDMGNRGNEEYLDWCIQNQFEFLALNEKRPEDADERDKFGYDRVMEAIENNMWGSDPTDEKTADQISYIPEILPKTTTDIHSEIDQKISEDPETDISILNRYLPLNFFDSLSNPNPQTFDFDAALVQLLSLKQTAQSLPDKERRDLAASVALGFARLLGEECED